MGVEVRVARMGPAHTSCVGEKDDDRLENGEEDAVCSPPPFLGWFLNLPLPSLLLCYCCVLAAFVLRYCCVDAVLGSGIGTPPPDQAVDSFISTNLSCVTVGLLVYLVFISKCLTYTTPEDFAICSLAQEGPVIIGSPRRQGALRNLLDVQ